jgi:hypothetical protein
MSFGNQKIFSGVQEILVLALMIVSVFTIIYANIDWTYKISIALIAFMVIFLSTIATQILRQQKAQKKALAA